jgi:hypothetical protein
MPCIRTRNGTDEMFVLLPALNTSVTAVALPVMTKSLKVARPVAATAATSVVPSSWIGTVGSRTTPIETLTTSDTSRQPLREHCCTITMGCVRSRSPSLAWPGSCMMVSFRVPRAGFAEVRTPWNALTMHWEQACLEERTLLGQTVTEDAGSHAANALMYDMDDDKEELQLGCG